MKNKRNWFCSSRPEYWFNSEMWTTPATWSPHLYLRWKEDGNVEEQASGDAIDRQVSLKKERNFKRRSEREESSIHDPIRVFAFREERERGCSRGRVRLWCLFMAGYRKRHHHHHRELRIQRTVEKQPKSPPYLHPHEPSTESFGQWELARTPRPLVKPLGASWQSEREMMNLSSVAFLFRLLSLSPSYSYQNLRSVARYRKQVRKTKEKAAGHTHRPHHLPLFLARLSRRRVNERVTEKEKKSPKMSSAEIFTRMSFAWYGPPISRSARLTRNCGPVKAHHVLPTRNITEKKKKERKNV